MDFALGESHRLVREAARDFASRRLAPLAREIEDSKALPVELFRELGRIGLLGLSIPEAYGGSEQGFLASAIAGEELGRASAAFSLSFGAHAFLCAHNLCANADDAQRRRFLPKLCSGEWIGAFALTEPGSGSDAASLQTRAVRRGDRWVLNGTKIFITNGSIARVFLLFARTGRRRGHGALSAFVVERDAPGFSVGRDIEKLGTCGSPLSELVLQDCEVPAENLVGQEGDGLKIMLTGLDTERSVFSGLAVGIGQAALDCALDYAAKRRQFQQPIASFQLVQEMLSQTATELEAARLLTYQAAWRLDQGLEVSKQASFAKLFAAQMVVRAAQQAVQILGGYGYTKEFPAERLYRDAILTGIGGGTSQIQQLIIARELLKERARKIRVPAAA
ncbi:MAG: acyl-CoA dehydrogenase family protein [Elusimicrobia bacterium]|nr:acyl-CoA dehydrogenase family protein [Elusimicrobiota bacterium]